MSDEIMKVKDLAKYLGVSMDRAYELVHRKDFPSFRMDNSFRVYKPDLIRWIRNQYPEIEDAPQEISFLSLIAD